MRNYTNKVETFKCATGQGWGVLWNNLVDGDLCYFRDEGKAARAARDAYKNAKVITTKNKRHYSNKGE